MEFPVEAFVMIGSFVILYELAIVITPFLFFYLFACQLLCIRNENLFPA